MSVPSVSPSVHLDHLVSNSNFTLQDVCDSHISSASVNEVYRAHIAQTVTSISAIKSKLPSFTVKASLKPDQQTALTRTFSEFNITFTPVDYSPHGFAREHRRLSWFKFVNDFNVDRDSRNILIKDVGGNPVQHYSQENLFVHACQPNLSYADSIRCSNTHHHFNNVVNPSPDQVHYLQHQNVYYCHNVSQNCPVRAKYCTFLHSIYDIDTPALSAILSESNCEKAFGCFIFDASILTSNSTRGYLDKQQCYWSIERRDNRRIIYFTFENDTQLSYCHDYEQYISLLRNFVIYTISGPYLFSISQIVDQVCYFTIIKSVCRVPHSFVRRPIPLCLDSDKIVIYYWSYNDVPRVENLVDIFFNRKMFRKRLVVSKRLCDLISSFIYQLPDASRTIDKVMTAAVSFSKREVINGAALKATYEIEPQILAELVYILYIDVMIHKFNLTQGYTIIKNDIMSTQKHNSSNYFVRLFNNIFSVPVSRSDADVAFTDSFSTTLTNTLREEAWSTIDVRISWILSHIRNTYKDNKYAAVRTQSTFLTLDEELQLLVSPIHSSAGLDVHSLNNYNSQITDTKPPLVPNCFFYPSLRTVFPLRQFLEAHYPDVDPCTQFSFNQICTILSTYSIVTGNNIYLKHNSQIYLIKNDVSVEYIIMEIHNLVVYSLNHADTIPLIDAPMNMYESVYDTAFSQFDRRQIPLTTNTFGYPCISGLKTADIISKFAITFKRPLCLGAPGASAWYIIDRFNISVFGISIIGTDFSDWNTELFHNPLFNELRYADNDILKPEVLNYYTVNEKFDYIDGDLAVQFDDPNCLNVFNAEIDFVLGCTMVGGCAQIKVHFLPFKSETEIRQILPQLFRLCENFSSVQLYKTIVATQNTEFHIVCRNFGCSQNNRNVFHRQYAEIIKLHRSSILYFYDRMYGVNLDDAYYVYPTDLQQLFDLKKKIKKPRNIKRKLVFTPASTTTTLLGKIKSLFTTTVTTAGTYAFTQDPNVTVPTRTLPTPTTLPHSSPPVINKTSQAALFLAKRAAKQNPILPPIPLPANSSDDSDDDDSDDFCYATSTVQALIQPPATSSNSSGSLVPFTGTTVIVPTDGTTPPNFQLPPNTSHCANFVHTIAAPTQYTRYQTRGQGNCGIHAITRNNDINCAAFIRAISQHPRFPTAPPNHLAQWYFGYNLTENDLAAIAYVLGSNLHIHTPMTLISYRDPLILHELCMSYSNNHYEMSTCVRGGSGHLDAAIAEYHSYCREIVRIVSSNIRCNHKIYSLIPNKKDYTKADALFNKSYLVSVNKATNTYFLGGKIFDIKPYQYFFTAEGVLRPIRYLDNHKFDIINGEECIFLNEFCRSAIEQVFLDKHSLTTPSCKIKFCQAAPGCGKTHSILNNPLLEDSLVILHSNHSVTDFESRLGEYSPKEVVNIVKAITMKPETFKVVFVDEVVIQHVGCILSLLTKFNARRCFLSGDMLQANFHNLLGDYKLNYSIFNNTIKPTTFLNVSYRIPADIAAFISESYVQKTGSPPIMTHNDLIGTSVSIVPINTIYDLDKSFKYLVFSDEENVLVPNSTTIVKFQGCQAQHIRIVRLHRNPQHPLFNDPYIVNTALTRHTHSLTYYCLATITSDLLYDSILRIQAIPQSESVKHIVLRAGGVDHADFISPLVSDINYFGKYSRDMKSVYFLNTIGQIYDLHKQDVAYVCVDPVIFKKYDPTMVYKLILVNRFSKNVRIVAKQCDAKVFSTVTEFFFSNALFDEPYSEFLPLSCQVDSYADFFYHFVPISIEYVQNLLSSIIGIRTFDEVMFDSYLVNSIGNLDLFVDREVSFNVIKNFSRVPEICNLSPHLHAPIPTRRGQIFNETLLAAIKRNFLVPNLQLYVDVDAQADLMVKNFLFKCCKNFERVNISPSMSQTQAWLQKQGITISNLLQQSALVADTPGNIYDFSIKSSPKKVFPDFIDIYPALQTISAHPKNINAYFSPLFCMYRDKILSVLNNNICIFTKLDIDSLANRIPNRIMGMQKVELDISKYDKSQSLLALLVEYKLMRTFGFSKLDCDVWFNMRHYCRFSSTATGIKFDVLYQMKSGVASTFISNTLHQMCVLFSEWHPSPDSFSLFCGDDSLLFDHQFSRDDLQLYRFSTIYNFDIKRFNYQSLYFAGKFICYDNNRFVVVPDPIKFLFSLCRSDVPNFSMLKEIAVSYLSLFTPDCFTTNISNIVNDGLVERYKVHVSFRHFYMSIPFILTNFTDFFFVDPSAKIDESVRINL